MFTFRRPKAAQVDARIAAAALLHRTDVRFLHVEGRGKDRVPFLFAQDSSTTIIGRGEVSFAAARRAFERWAMFDLGWVRVANPEAQIVTGQLVAVEAETLGLWTLNLSRIVEIADKPWRYGFVYATTGFHVEEGEEWFLIEIDGASGDVTYNLEAVSRPRSNLARLGWPIARMFQHRFARDSHRRMREAVHEADTLEA